MALSMHLLLLSSKNSCTSMCLYMALYRIMAYIICTPLHHFWHLALQDMRYLVLSRKVTATDKLLSDEKYCL